VCVCVCVCVWLAVLGSCRFCERMGGEGRGPEGGRRGKGFASRSWCSVPRRAQAMLLISVSKNETNDGTVLIAGLLAAGRAVTSNEAK